MRFLRSRARRSPRGIHRLLGVASWVALGLLVAGWAVFLRPPVLGGQTSVIVVRGSSMVPTYHLGDLLVIRAEPRYSVGDVAAYRVPRGELGAGQVVIHRIIGGDGVHGFTLKGDNNLSQDPWHPSKADIVGRPWAVLTGWGRAVALLRTPLVMGGLAAAITVSAVLARAPRRRPSAVRELRRTIDPPVRSKERTDHGRQPDDHPLSRWRRNAPQRPAA